MTRRPSGTAWTGWRVLVALVVVVGGLQLVPVAASAAPVAGTLTATPDPPTVSEQVELTGSLPPARPRPVTLERRTGTGAWTQVGSGRTAADGSVEFDVTMPGAVGATVSYRVQAAEVRRDGTVLPAVQTPDVVLTTVAQSATLVLPASVAAGSSFEAVADFSPDRPGRQVVLQRRSGNRWQTSATSTQDASGTVRFVVPAGSDTGPQTFRAVAKKDAGAPRVISPSATVNVTTEEDTTPPAVPAGLAAVPGDSAAALSWDEVGDADLTGYRVHRAPAATGPWTLAASPTGTTHEELGLTNGTTYWFAVSAVDADGNESARSAAAFVTPVDSTAPAAPSGLAATAGDGSVSLAWDEVADATGYVVAQGPSADGPWTTAGSPSEESLEVLGLTNGTPYWFTVAAVDAAGNDSAPSAPVSATPVDQTPPPAVTLLSATPHDRSVVLVWEESSAVDLASYRIEWAGAADGPFTTAVPSITDTTYTFTGLTNGTTRWYRVVGVDAAGNASAPSEALGATPFDDAAPGVPAPVSVIAHDRGVELSWGGQYGGDTAGFNVWTSSSAEGPWTLVDGSPFASPPLTIDGLTNGTTYWFSVSSLDTSGNESERSEAASATPFDNAPPPTPTGVTAVASPGKVTVSWDAVVDEALVDYVVLRGASATGPWERYDYTTSTATAYEDANVVPGATYWYTVQSVDAAGNWSPPSTAVEATAADTTPPAAPTGLGATPGANQVVLAWDPVGDSDLVGYQVYRGPSASGPWTVSGTLVTATTTTVTGVQNGVEHWFAVDAVDTVGNRSPLSGPASATPQLAAAQPSRVATDSQHTCAVRADNTLWCWGVGANGRLGNGVLNDVQATPAQVGTANDWAGVTVGGGHSCATRLDGTAWCWGWNIYGQIGDGTTTEAPTPVRVGSADDWLLLSAGGGTTCGLRSDRSLWCWGQGQLGQLGTGGTASASTPQQVPGSWTRVSFGGARVCAVRADGGLFCWGYGFGGFGTMDLAPVQVGTSTDWTDVAVGGDHACGLRTGSRPFCWGSGTAGQLGNATTGNSSSPVPVSGGLTFAMLSAGGQHTCGTRGDATIWCWGAGATGQLGGGSATSRTTPGQVAGAGSWREVGAGNSQTCGSSTSGAISCWGYAGSGVLGTGRTESELLPALVQPGSTWRSASTGHQHGCGVRSDRTLWCWGYNGSGRTGTGTTYQYAPAQVGTATDWSTVSAGAQHSCATRSGGSLWCWGENSSGALGDGSTLQRSAPVRVGTATSWTTVHAGSSFTCGTRTDTSLWCWGSGDQGQLGTGGSTGSTVPLQVPGTWASVEVGQAQACGVRTDGSLWCWGENFLGQLGDGTRDDRLAPVQVGSETDWVSVSSGGAHTCGTRGDATIWCWGYGSSLQLGNGATGIVTSPVQVGSATDWAQVEAGGSHSCGRKTDGSVLCWGTGNYGQLGDGTTTNLATPVTSQTVASSAVLASTYDSCSLDTAGLLRCWGWNNIGQAGVPPYETVPVPVAG